MNWNRISLFKLPNRHKRFDYVPRYYDADKEALQRKIDQANREAGLTATSNHSREIEFRSQINQSGGILNINRLLCDRIFDSLLF